ncbi:MAG TPA: hypothetical protein VFO98_06115 [Marmoricola sp.]|jgi:hypothetical protein|nr:hypothetical protein [Marmoricola sp.]
MQHKIDQTAHDLTQQEETMWHTTEQNKLANLIIDERVRTARRVRARKTRRDNRGIR